MWFAIFALLEQIGGVLAAQLVNTKDRAEVMIIFFHMKFLLMRRAFNRIMHSLIN